MAKREGFFIDRRDRAVFFAMLVAAIVGAIYLYHVLPPYFTERGGFGSGGPVLAAPPK